MTKFDNTSLVTSDDADHEKDEGIRRSAMTKFDNTNRVTSNDVEHEKEGIMSSEQDEGISESGHLLAAFAAPSSSLSQGRPLDGPSVAYYFGGFLTLAAFSYFIAMRWESFGELGQFLVSLFSLAIVGGIGWMLRRSGFVLAGNILIFVATALVYWVGYNFIKLVGLWPPFPDDGESYGAYEMMVRTQRMTLEVISIIAALVAVRVTRFPLITTLIAFWSYYFSLEIAGWLSPEPWYIDGKLAQIVGVIYGLVMLGVGVYLQQRATHEYSDWFYRAGHLAIFINAILFIYSTEVVVGLVFLPLYFAFLVVSVLLKRRIFLVFGALNSYVYIAYLTYKVFNNSPDFALIMAGVGLLVIVSTAFYQRYIQPWLKVHMHEYGELGL